MKVLVDSAVWSLVFRRRRQDLNPVEAAIRDEFTELLKEDRAHMIGAIRQEVLSGVRDEKQFEMLRAGLRPFPDEELSADDYETAAAASNTCRAAGISGSAIDFLICAVAMRRKWLIFSTDRDYMHYQKRLPIDLHAAPPR